MSETGAMRDTAERGALEALGSDIREAYAREKRVMSFAEYFALFEKHPRRHARSSATYIRDAFDHYGTDRVPSHRGEVTRWRLFDCPWDDGRDRLIGQEQVQARVYRTLSSFTRVGRANKLILLHGPNGSAKSTFVSCIARGLENYSSTEEGALYRFNWMFPTKTVQGSGGIGFGSGPAGGTGASGAMPDPRGSYAYLADEQLDARLRDDLRDHPLLLIPAERRRDILARLLAGGDESDGLLSNYLLRGELSPRNRQIYEALLVRYQGDYMKVLQHVQVQRFYIQPRYREGAVTIEPQMHVDARSRQISLDKSLQTLPSVLQSVSLFEYSGDLVEANRGVVEFADLLKRPLEAFKYLLGTVEHSFISVDSAILHLDVVFIGSSNEEHLGAFKETADWLAFRGRIELIRVPLLVDYTQEQQIYEQKLSPESMGKEVAPHAMFVAALWAVLTRMRKPLTEKYAKEIGDLVSNLSPLQKARLYAHAEAPESFTSDQAKELVSHMESIATESEPYPNYEGRTGASPREINTLLLHAAANPQFPALSPAAVLAELRQLVKNVTVYHFLKQDPQPGGFHENERFIAVVENEWLDRVDDEVRASMGLVDESEYQRYFQRYVTHVTHWVGKEQVKNPVTGGYDDPDEELMRGVEKRLEIDSDREEFRRDLMSRIGAWSVDHPNQRPDYPRIFRKEFVRLKESYYQEQQVVVRKLLRELAALLGEDADEAARAAGAKNAERSRAIATLEALKARHGYSDTTAKEALMYLLKARYA